jgi:polyhydroxyalkanoate synthesis regulator phasin
MNSIEKIHGKQYGKQWAYVARQDEYETPSQEEINKMDAQIDAFKKQIVDLKEEVLGCFGSLE